MWQMLGMQSGTQRTSRKNQSKIKKNRHKGVVGGKAALTHNGGSASHQQIVSDMVSGF